MVPVDPMATPADSEAVTALEVNSGGAEAGKELRLPPRIGRYTVIRKLGEGGMGAVYMAYDEELDRRVALKLLHPRLGESESVQTRMQREAQALARINDPHVVQIYDVGHFNDQLYVAMELVDGMTLRQWSKAQPRSWREVQAVMIQAGEGLAAAHRAGLIHRDIKPDNILVGDDGRARVADFGLARSEHIDQESSPDSTTASTSASRDTTASVESMVASAPSLGSGAHVSTSALNSPLTVAGTLLGTPAYMAPEQHMRQPVDARADIFAFCVVLYEALYGRRPFSGKTRVELTRAIIVGTFEPPAREHPVPSWLLRLIRSGLVAEPDERLASMELLLGQLRRDPAKVRARRLRLAAIGTLVIGAAVGGAAMRTDPVAACAETYAPLLTAWEEQRSSVQEALTSTPTELGAMTWRGISGDLDGYSSELRGMYDQTCQGHRRGRISAQLHDLTIDCLDRRHGEFVALIDLLREGDPTRLENAISAVRELPLIEDCADVPSLLDRVAPPADPATAAAVAELRKTLDQVRAMRRLGEFLPAKPIAEAKVAEARELAYPPVIAEALVEEGMLALETNDHRRAAVELFPEAIAIAERSGDDGRRLDALIGLLTAYGQGGGTKEGLALLEPQGRALVDRRKLSDDVIHGRLLVGIGESYQALRLHDEATAILEEALALYKTLGADARLDLAMAANDLAMLRSHAHRYDEAHALYAEARAALVETLGPRHPHVGHLSNNEARAYEKEGNTEKAREYFENALAIWTPAYGDSDLTIDIVTGHLARVTLALGDLEAAERYARQSLTIREASGGERRVDAVLLILAKVAQAQDDLPSAEIFAARAQSSTLTRSGERSPKLIPVLGFRGRLALARGDSDEAARLLMLALDLEMSPETAAGLRLDLAEALWRSGRTEAARESALQALKAADPKLAPEVNVWLTGHGGGGGGRGGGGGGRSRSGAP